MFSVVSALALRDECLSALVGALACMCVPACVCACAWVCAAREQACVCIDDDCWLLQVV